MTTETRNFIEGMRKTSQLAARTLVFGGQQVQAGITTEEIDRRIHDYILSHGATPAPLNYHGFPKGSCTSVNDVVCHGVPDKTVLKNGDIVNIDVTTLLNGYFGDTSYTFYVGDVSEKAKKITQCAKEAMEKGIEMVSPFNTTGDIGFAINKFVTKNGFHVVREIGGHGIGKIFHDDPFVPSFGKKGRGDRLKPYRCITVEPMVNETGAELIEISIPGSSIKWYRTGDGSLSAQFEHTVLITDVGYEILTLA